MMEAIKSSVDPTYPAMVANSITQPLAAWAFFSTLIAHAFLDW
jgi:hypothetical protein